VALGYQDGSYKPTLPVAHIQTISFITRAIGARGYWTLLPDDARLYPNVPTASGHCEDLATYVKYVGPVPGPTYAAAQVVWDRPAARA